MQIDLVTRAALFSLILAIPLSGCASPAAKFPTQSTAQASSQAASVLRELKSDAKPISKPKSQEPNTGAEDAAKEAGADWRADIVMRAMTLLGVNYKFGGNSPDVGLDCSGFVRLVVKDVLGKVLPRRAEEISHSSQEIRAEDLKPGDLVFFNTLKKAFSHVGIYVGNNQFIHSPSAGGSVKIETLDKQYWNTRFDGARRLVGMPVISEVTQPSK